MAFLSRIKNWITLEILTADDLNAEFNNIVDNIVAGTTTAAGVVQLEDSHASTSTTKAACPKNVKEAYDLAGTMLTKAAFDAGTFMYAVSDNAPVIKTRAEVMALLSGQAGADFALNTHKLTGVVDPTANQDAATKKFVDDKHIYTNKPAFSAKITSNLADVTGNDTNYPLNTDVWTEHFDQGTDFANGVFTAPVTGKYLFTGALGLYNLGAAHTFLELTLMTTSGNYSLMQLSGAGRASTNYLIITWSWLQTLSTGQTAYLNANVKNGTKTVGVMSTNTTFGGALIC